MIVNKYYDNACWYLKKTNKQICVWLINIIDSSSVEWQAKWNQKPNTVMQGILLKFF